jgi:hypothetical protein
MVDLLSIFQPRVSDFPNRPRAAVSFLQSYWTFSGSEKSHISSRKLKGSK